MKRMIVICTLVSLCLLGYSQKNCPDTLTDQDGYMYHGVVIGNQCWMKENIRAKYDREGVLVSKGNVESSRLDVNPEEIGRCYPDGNQENHESYGYLYTWSAAMKVCPRGWHLPTHAEWSELQYYLMGNRYCGDSRLNTAKALADKEGWEESIVKYSVGNRPSQNNATDFSALPAGIGGDGYQDFGRSAYFWCATEFEDDHAYTFVVSFSSTDPHMLSLQKGQYLSVRCLRDEGVAADKTDAKDSDKAKTDKTETTPVENEDYFLYEIKAGDQLGKIGLKYGFTGKQLQEYNNMTEEQTRKLQIGQKIKIPKKQPQK